MLNTASYQLLCGDALTMLRTLPDGIADTCVTSPPYLWQRDYGVPGQIGHEPTIQEYIASLVAVFQEVRRVLRDDGTCWINIADTFAGSGKGNTPSGNKDPKAVRKSGMSVPGTKAAIPSKNLLLIPSRLVIALQDDGWIIRCDIVWEKIRYMPSPVRDRPTVVHEYLFLLAKQEDYYYDYDAIKEPMTESSIARLSQKISTQAGSVRANGGAKTNGAMKAVGGAGGYRNKTSVWSMPNGHSSDEHTATFPPDLIRPCILAGSREDGTVLDPFSGSGTTGQVAIEEGREYIGIDLNPSYLDLTRKRLAGITPPLFGRSSVAIASVGSAKDVAMTDAAAQEALDLC